MKVVGLMITLYLSFTTLIYKRSICMFICRYSPVPTPICFPLLSHIDIYKSSSFGLNEEEHTFRKKVVRVYIFSILNTTLIGEQEKKP